jgi:hypothetical protein
MEETAHQAYVLPVPYGTSLTLPFLVHKDGAKKSKSKKDSGSNLFV